MSATTPRRMAVEHGRIIRSYPRATAAERPPTSAQLGARRRVRSHKAATGARAGPRARTYPTARGRPRRDHPGRRAAAPSGRPLAPTCKAFAPAQSRYFTASGRESRSVTTLPVVASTTTGWAPEDRARPGSHGHRHHGAGQKPKCGDRAPGMARSASRARRLDVTRSERRRRGRSRRSLIDRPGEARHAQEAPRWRRWAGGK